jgi:hypothetical protein
VGFPAIVTILIQLKKLNATPDISAESPIIPIGDVNEELKIYHDYYPWVPLVFGLSGIFFYLPRMLWKKKERGFMAKCTKGMEFAPVSAQQLEKHVLHLRFMLYNSSCETIQSYLTWFLVSEVLTLINIGIQWTLFNVLLHGHFNRYGLEFLQYTYHHYVTGNKDSFTIALQNEELHNW